MSTALRDSQRGILNWVWGGGISLDPTYHPEITDRHPFEWRTVVGADESCTLVRQPSGLYAAKSPNGRSWLSVQPNGALEERSTADPGQPNGFECGPYDAATRTWHPPHGPAWMVEGDQPAQGGGGPLTRLHATRDGFLNEAGELVPIAGVSAFMHYEKWLRGEDLGPRLRQVQDLGSNCLRVFGMAHHIPVNAGRPPFRPQDFGEAYFDRQPEFEALVAEFGQYTYWSVFPDGNIILPGIDQQRPFFDREVGTLLKSPNTLGELTNEQDAHSFNTIDPTKVTRPTGIAFTSGSYGDIGGPQPHPWDFCDYHTPRDWPIKAVKDSCVVDHPNYVQGKGVMLGEPDRFGSGGNSNQNQARQQAGAARESAIGHIFHSANGRESLLYDDQTLAIATIWFKAAIGRLR